MTERDPVKEVFIVGIVLWVVVFLIFALSGCVSAPIAPNLKVPEQKECPKLEMPPVPNDVEMDVKGNKIQKLNAGGDVLLRGYVQARKLLQ